MQLTNYLHLLCRETYLVDAIFSDNNIKITSFKYLNIHRLQYAAIAMKAMEQLLQACRSSSINLFVESFLRMVQKLLECSEPDLQILGTTSFVQFANIQEDTPSYHRRYDFFVSKFR